MPDSCRDRRDRTAPRSMSLGTLRPPDGGRAVTHEKTEAEQAPTPSAILQRMVGERPQTRTPAVLAWTAALLGRLCPPAFLRSLHAALSSLFAGLWRAGPALAATAARWVSPASSASTGAYRLVAVVFLTGCALRVILSFLNQEANDDHMAIIRTIAFEDRVPGLRDDWQGYQPKLYHWTVALLLRLLAPWVADSGDVQVRIANLVNCAAGIALLLVARSWLKRSSLPTPAVLMIFGFLVLNPRLVGIGSQATNDTLVILFGTLSLFWGVRFFDAMSWRALFGMCGFTALAVLTKGNGLVILLAHVCVFTVVLVRRAGATRDERGAEREERTRQQAGAVVAGPASDEPIRCERRERQSCEDQQVVRKQRRTAEPVNRRRHQAGNDERFGVDERVGVRMKHVRVEQMHGIARNLVCNPGQGPRVEPLVVIEKRQVRRPRRERPRMNGRKGEKQCSRQQPLVRHRTMQHGSPSA